MKGLIRAIKSQKVPTDEGTEGELRKIISEINDKSIYDIGYWLGSLKNFESEIVQKNRFVPTKEKEQILGEIQSWKQELEVKISQEIEQELNRIMSDEIEEAATLDILRKLVEQAFYCRGFFKSAKISELCEKLDNYGEVIKERMVKKNIIELGMQFSRMQLTEIAEKCRITNLKTIERIICDMIKKQEINAEYFPSTQSLLFRNVIDQSARDDFIKNLDREFASWRESNKKKD